MSVSSIASILACFTACLPIACSADPSERNSKLFGQTERADSEHAPCAVPGLVTCLCTDGTPTGTQLCDVDGTLTACQCPKLDADDGASSVLAPNVGGVCKELEGAAGCTAQTYRSKQVPVSVLFLMDRSGSMACNPPPLQSTADCETAVAAADPTRSTKWQITTDALKRVLDELLAQHSTASVGLSFFSNDDACGVQSMPSVGVNPLSVPQVLALENALDQTRPSGGTPSVGATILAYAYLHQEAGNEPGCTEPCGANGNRFVVLITDGADSCATPSRAEDAERCADAGSCTDYLLGMQAPLALQANIRTFVIGVPGSEPARGYLSALAFRGGTARNGGQCRHDLADANGDCHFDMTHSASFADDLAHALSTISGAALGCELAVPSSHTSIDEQHVNVQYRAQGTGAPVCFAYDARPCDAGSDGWQFAKQADGSDDLSRVIICGKSCETVRRDSKAQIDVVLGCQTLE